MVGCANLLQPLHDKPLSVLCTLVEAECERYRYGHRLIHILSHTVRSVGLVHSLLLYNIRYVVPGCAKSNTRFADGSQQYQPNGSMKVPRQKRGAASQPVMFGPRNCQSCYTVQPDTTNSFQIVKESLPATGTHLRISLNSPTKLSSRSAFSRPGMNSRASENMRVIHITTHETETAKPVV